jgi:energy-coupling factor transporter ATP-binding protein EcfA2
MKYPAKTIVDAFRACNPVETLDADDPRYVDFSSGRGDEGLAAAQCRKRIVRSDSPLVQLLAGHRGCGKSTELRRLKRSLEESKNAVALLDAETDLDLEDTEPTDILLALIRGLEEELRKQKLQLKAEDLKSFESWFTETVIEKTDRTQFETEIRAEIKAEANVPFFASLMAKFSGWIKRGTDSKTTVRRKLEPQLSQLIDRGALLFQQARNLVQNEGKKDLVVIVDGLDRIALKRRDNGQSSHEFIFIERGDLLRGFACHTILTVPISLMFSAQASNLGTIFPTGIFCRW